MHVQAITISPGSDRRRSRHRRLFRHVSVTRFDHLFVSRSQTHLASFFEKNLRHLPLFDKKLNANECHAASPLLFWAIVLVGSRRYTRDPTLNLQLAPKVLNLAKSALFAQERMLCSIQALVILCTWHVPIDTLQKDIAPQLAGAMIQLATFIGLHVYGSVQDFSRVPLKYDQQQKTFRARLWSICLYTCQR